MRIFIGLALALSLAASGCSGTQSGERREFRLQGQILSIRPDHREAVIRHEEIAGFMPAMTMPYAVQDPSLYEHLAPGDLITATLVVLPTAAFLEDVKKVGDAPLEGQTTGRSGAASGFELIKVGSLVPDETFVDQDGQSVSLESFRGSAVIVTFMYTSCPMPTFCPLMDRYFAKIQGALQANGNVLKTHLLSVSFDPEIDTPAVLKAHANGLGADPRLWSFVTGDRDAIDKWASGFGVSISRTMNDPRDITHNLRTALIDRQGHLVQVYNGNEWTPEQVLADVRVMVGVD